jgi:hypothetical protein
LRKALAGMGKTTRFLDADFAQLYVAAVRIAQRWKYFAGIAILISCFLIDLADREYSGIENREVESCGDLERGVIKQTPHEYRIINRTIEFKLSRA